MDSFYVIIGEASSAEFFRHANKFIRLGYISASDFLEKQNYWQQTFYWPKSAPPPAAEQLA